MAFCLSRFSFVTRACIVVYSPPCCFCNMAKKTKTKMSPEMTELRRNVTYFVSLIVVCRVAQAMATAVMQSKS